MASGGYRKPPAKVGVSGPGKYSKRTDARKVPSLDNSDMQYGDVQRLSDARKTAPPASGTPEQTFAPPGGSQSGSGQSGGSGSAGLPPFLFDSPSGRPQESILTGIDKRIPDPNDTKELVLTYLAEKYGNATAKKWLDELRGVSQGATMAPGGSLGQPAQSLGSDLDAGVGGGGLGGPAPVDVLDTEGPTLDEPFSDSVSLDEEPAEEEPILG